jgi:hypothetical protein
MFSVQSNMRRHAHTHLQVGNEVACESKGDEESEEAPICTHNMAVYTPYRAVNIPWSHCMIL